MKSASIDAQAVTEVTAFFSYIKKLDSSVEKNKKCCFKQHMFLNDS